MGGPDAPEFLRQLIWYSTRVGDFTVAVNAVKDLAEYGVEELTQYNVEEYVRLQAMLRGSADSRDLRYEFLRTLYENNLVSRNQFYSVDELMIEYAAMSIDRGDNQDIKKIILSLTEPSAILRVRIDRRFDAARQDSVIEEHIDLEKAAERYIDKLAALVEKWPDYALGHVQYSRALIGSWRFEDALNAIEPIALKIRAPNASELFIDAESSKNWVLEQYSLALSFEQFPEQSEDMFKEAVDAPEIGHSNVSQRINMAGSLVYGGHLDRAMEFLDDLDDSGVSSFGRMWVQSIAVCTSAMRQDVRDYSANMTYLMANERDNPSALIEALLCTNDIATAAQHLIKRIRDPDQRILALLYLQKTKRDGHAERQLHEHAAMDGLSPGHILRHRFDQLRERGDLLTAVNLVGRIEEVPLQSSFWMRF
jgi:tetratricopeptide (TPR) repeat protein